MLDLTKESIMNNNNKQQAQLDHINFTVSDIKKTIQWYDNIFNFKVVESGFRDDGAPWAIIRSGDSMLAFSERPERTLHERDKDHRIFHFALRLTNKTEWEATVKKYKIKLGYGGPVKYPNSTSWYVQDPTGYEIEVAIWDNNEIKFN